MALSRNAFQSPTNSQQRSHVDQSVVASGQVRPSAAPRPIAGMLDQVGTHRVEFHVPGGGQQVRLVHHERREPPLPEIPPPFLAKVDPSCVALMHFAYGQTQTVLRRRDRDSMDVVGHQAIPPDLHRTLATPLGRQLQVGRVVPFVEERLLAAVASLRHMVRHARNDQSC
jgi:hypothetical protein